MLKPNVTFIKLLQLNDRLLSILHCDLVILTSSSCLTCLRSFM